MRWFFLALLIAAAAVGAGWYFDFLRIPTSPLTGLTSTPIVEPVEAKDLGDLLYRPARPPEISFKPKKLAKTPIILDDYHLAIVDKQEVPSLKEGKILFIGEPISENNAPPGAELFKASVLLGGKKQDIVFRRWNENDVVKENQMLAYVNPELALQERDIAKRKLKQAEA